MQSSRSTGKGQQVISQNSGGKATMAKAKEKPIHHHTHPTTPRAVPFPRLVNDPPVLPVVPLPRVQASPTGDDCRVGGVGSDMQNVNTPSQFVGSQLQIVKNVTQQQGKHRPPIMRPNYILQDDDIEQHHGYNTRLRTTSIMHEAMLECINITKPKFELLAAKMSSRRIPMTL